MAMMDGADIDDFDLLAYADGRLADDPTRRRHVERWLSRQPEAAAKVDAYAEQNVALHQAYGWRLSEPVPMRLHRAVERPAPRRSPRLAHYGAVAALITVTTGLGWMAGQRGPGPDPAMDEFLQQSYSHYRGVPAERDGAAIPPERGGVHVTSAALPAGWPAGAASLILAAPDLGSLGYAMTERQAVDTSSEPLVRLTYEGRQGSRFHLFVRPRWSGDATTVQLARRDDLSLAYWLDGPLASAIVANVPPEEALFIANAVRDAMARPSAAPPAVPVHRNIADGAADHGPLRPNLPAAPLPRTALPAGESAGNH